MSDDREEFIQGPGRDYVPTPHDDLRDDHGTVQARGSALVRRVLAESGIRKVDGKWLVRESSSSDGGS